MENNQSDLFMQEEETDVSADKAAALDELGNCYKYVYWWTEAAEQGSINAQAGLGVCYENGEGVEQDDANAAYWYRKAAEQGHADAQFNLGVCYANGRGVEQDWGKAVLWYAKAAEQGEMSAHIN